MARPRKRGPVAELAAEGAHASPAEDTSFDPAELEAQPDPVIQADGVIHAPAEPQPETHAEQIERRNSGLSGRRTDLLAGVKLSEGWRLIGNKKIREAVVAFEEKPSAEVITLMKDAGFQWLAEAKVWAHEIRSESAWQDRAHGEATFEAAAKAVRSERGIEHSAGLAVG